VGLDHDAAMRIGGDAPGDGPILWDGVEKPCLPRVTDTSDRYGHPAAITAMGPAFALALCCRPTGHVVGRSTTPSGTSPVVANRHNPMSSLRANATIIVLRVAPRRSAVRAQYHCARALFF
jgi:hypothetical protein